MKRCVCLIIVMSGIASAGFAAVETSRITPARIVIPPRIDGRLDDAAWEQAAVVENIRPNRSAGQNTTVRLAYDDANLYAGWTCYEARMDERVTACCRTRDAGWGDDDVEVYLQPNPPDGPVFEIVVNAANVVLDVRYTDPKRNGDRKWDCALRSAVSQREDAWCVEMAIPWADLELSGSAGPSMGFNLCRWQPILAGVSSHWALPGHPKFIEFLGRLEGLDLDFSAYSVRADSPRLREGLCYGANEIPVVLRNTGSAPRKLRVEGRSAYPDGSPMLAPAAVQRIELPAGGEAEVVLTIPATEPAGVARGQVQVCDAQTDRVLHQITRWAPVPETLLFVKPARRYLYAGDEELALNLYGLIGEASLPGYRIRITAPGADGMPLIRTLMLASRNATVPLAAQSLPLGDSEIEFAVQAVGTGKVLERVTTKVVRLTGPFDP
ncbi:MAG: hypothetical protein JXR37_34270 [Kiritimatiellae bacterium]|nr:hypothetical protein [Kiritimatiellia bacterium]